ncbi:MAG: AMP-binding protein [Legionellaceae bacterium]|nr:AMP-binding protein [Legionellaceae bacterium]MBP9776002.1 AMP-binding protein [Legionellaceae bacterium]
MATQWLDITYIPVDPSIPIERLRAIIIDSQPQLLIYDVNTHPQFEELPCTLFNVVERLSSPRSFLEDSLENYVPTPSGIAYIIYTSGSTGKPKGVAIPRHALHNLLTSMSQCLLQEEHALALAITTISFDISVIDIYLPFWQQKSVFIANQLQHKDPLSLAEILNNYPITFIQTTPSGWNMLLNLEWTSQLNLIAACSGEPLTKPLAQRILEKASVLWNMYGPTEATVWCASKQILPNTPITIGRPIHNIEMRVMDEEQQILPPYVKGELYIGGIGLAEEYINNPELTSKKFVSCQNALLNRLYQVGDLACTTEEGEFIIFGRTDNQIKLHGYRIELEEIEAQIQAFPGIQEGAVTVHHEQLIAYISWLSEEAFSKPKFIQHLAKYLREYMVPKNVTLLKQLPKTVSGKIDRKALPLPVITPSLTPNTSQLSATQLSLTQIWTEELSHDTIGINDNFFELGGHSLIMARIIVKVAQQLGKEMHLQDIYRAPTIEQFSKLVEQASLAAKKTRLVPKHAHALPLPDFTFMFWLSQVFDSPGMTRNVVGRRRVQGVLYKENLDLALQLVLKNQKVFSYHIHHYYPLQTLCTLPSIKSKQWTETTLFHLSDTEIEPYLTQNYNNLFYKKTWRYKTLWIHAHLYHLKNDQSELQICMSHMIADEKSVSIFFQELSKMYLLLAQNSHLPVLDTHESYQDYAAQQNNAMQYHAHTDQIFWKKYLQDSGLLPIPHQFWLKKGSPIATHIPLPESFTLKLQQFCTNHHVGLNDVISAAVSLALLQCCQYDSQYLHQKLCFGIIKSTRDDPLYDHVIGCFLRMDAIKLDLNNQPTLLSLAKQSQQSVYETTTYQRASFLVKIGAIGKLQTTGNRLIKLFIRSSLNFLRKLFPKLEINVNWIEACENIVAWDKKTQLLININILNNFLNNNAPSTQPNFLGLTHKPIPLHPYPNFLDEYIFDIMLHRNNDQNLPFLIITAPLTSDFQKRFGDTLVSIIQDCPI